MQPKYYSVKESIISLIEDETYEKDEMIPSERELCTNYNVSRITIRKAIDELTSEGYLYKIHGKGTFVKNTKIENDLFSIVSCTEDIIKAGLTPVRVVIESTIVKADLKRSKALRIPLGQEVFKLDRVYYAGTDPINRTTTYLPYKYFPNIDSYDFAKMSLYDVLEHEYKVEITKAKRALEAVGASEATAGYLEVKPGTPILLFRATTYGKIGGKEVPIETFKTRYRTDKFKFHINQIR